MRRTKQTLSSGCFLLSIFSTILWGNRGIGIYDGLTEEVGEIRSPTESPAVEIDDEEKTGCLVPSSKPASLRFILDTGFSVRLVSQSISLGTGVRPVTLRTIGVFTPVTVTSASKDVRVALTRVSLTSTETGIISVSSLEASTELVMGR